MKLLSGFFTIFGLLLLLNSNTYGSAQYTFDTYVSYVSSGYDGTNALDEVKYSITTVLNPPMFACPEEVFRIAEMLDQASASCFETDERTNFDTLDASVTNNLYARGWRPIGPFSEDLRAEIEQLLGPLETKHILNFAGRLKPSLVHESLIEDPGYTNWDTFIELYGEGDLSGARLEVYQNMYIPQDSESHLWFSILSVIVNPAEQEVYMFYGADNVERQ